MDQEEFIRELYRRVDQAWTERNYLAWFVGSAMLTGARIARWAGVR